MKKKTFRDTHQLLEYCNRYDTARVKKQLSNFGSRTQKIAAVCVENTKNMLRESPEGFVGSSNIAGWTPVLLPLMSRLIPQLYAINLIGVQPMTQSTGKAFAIRWNYQGNEDTNGGGTVNNILTPADSMVVVMDTAGDSGTDDLTNTEYTISSVTGLSNAVKVVPVHVESNRVLLKITDFNSQSLDTILNDINVEASVVKITQGTQAYIFQVAIKNIDVVGTYFKNYTGPKTTDYMETNFIKRNKLGMEIISAVHEATTRELGADVSIYAYEDAMASHGFDIQSELLVSGSYTLAREIDGEIIAAIDLAATEAGPKTFDFADLTTHTNEISKIQTLVIAINNIANEITKASRAGRPNWLVVGATAASLLESLPGNQFAPAKVVSPTGEGFIGILNNRYSVYTDNYMDDLTILMGYKGPSELDTGIVFCPYRPIAARSTVGETDFRFKNLFNSRYSIVTSLYGAKNYYRKIVLTGITFLTD